MSQPGAPPPPPSREIVFDLFRAWEAESRAFADKLRELAAKNSSLDWAEDACGLANVIAGAADTAVAATGGGRGPGADPPPSFVEMREAEIPSALVERMREWMQVTNDFSDRLRLSDVERVQEVRKKVDAARREVLQLCPPERPQRTRGR